MEKKVTEAELIEGRIVAEVEMADGKMVIRDVEVQFEKESDFLEDGFRGY